MSFVNGQGRRVLVNTTVTASNGTLPTSIVFGTFLVSEFAGIAGMVKCESNFVATMAIRLSYLQTSGGTTMIDSTIAVTSGLVVNEFNPAPYVSLSVQGISSNTPLRAYLTGLPIR
jgi:hypothetical protein